MKKEKRNLVAALICIVLIIVPNIWFLGWEAAIPIVIAFAILFLWDWKLEKLTQRAISRYFDRKAKESRERGETIFINPYSANDPRWEEGERWERYYDELNRKSGP